MWQGLDLQVDFSDVWQAKELALGRDHLESTVNCRLPTRLAVEEMKGNAREGVAGDLGSVSC